MMEISSFDRNLCNKITFKKFFREINWSRIELATRNIFQVKVHFHLIHLIYSITVIISKKFLQLEFLSWNHFTVVSANCKISFDGFLQNVTLCNNWKIFRDKRKSCNFNKKIENVKATNPRLLLCEKMMTLLEQYLA